MQKLKPKLQFFLTLALVLSAVFLIFKPIETKASGYSVGGAGSMTESDSAGKGTTTLYGGPNWDHTGTLFYLVTPNNEQVTDSKLVTTNSQGIVDRAGKAIPSSNIKIWSRWAYKKPTGYTTNAPWGGPYQDGESRGADIKEWLLTPQDGHTRAAILIGDTWGGEWAKKWERKEVFLIFESVFWNHIYVNGVGTGKWFCGTTVTFGTMQSNTVGEGMGWNGTGDTMVRRYTNDVYPNCLKMEDCEEIRTLGYTAPPHGGLVTNGEMGGYRVGWGIGVVWNEQEAIHTYWSDNGSPGKPEPPGEKKKGDCNMVKSYYIEYQDANGNVQKLENKGTFYEKECTNVISIDDEPEYQLVKWKIGTGAANTGIVATNGSRVTWNPPRATQQGTTPQIKTLEGDETTVYVLLKKVEQLKVTPSATPEANYVLSESQITKQVWLSLPDGEDLSSNIIEHNFKWAIPAHATECSGHNVEVVIDCDGSCATQTYHDHSDTSKCYDNTGDGVCDVIYDTTDPCGQPHKTTKTVKCTNFKLTEKNLTFGIKNTLKNNYPDILSTKWRKIEAPNEQTTLSKDRADVTAQQYSIDNWDFKCVLMRGKDKLTCIVGEGNSTSKVLFFCIHNKRENSNM